MANPNPKTEHLLATRWQPGQSGNPGGKIKGTKHISTWIQELLNDEGFTAALADGSSYRGAPGRAIVMVAIQKAVAGDRHWADWLGRYSARAVELQDSAGISFPVHVAEQREKYGNL